MLRHRWQAPGFLKSKRASRKALGGPGFPILGPYIPPSLAWAPGERFVLAGLAWSLPLPWKRLPKMKIPACRSILRQCGQRHACLGAFA